MPVWSQGLTRLIRPKSTERGKVTTKCLFNSMKKTVVADFFATHPATDDLIDRG